MKNVRLFAVAAALGMFASTVAAAETTSKTTVKWTGADTIIKVDLGEEVVVPTLTATATTTTYDETKCANGTDANGDGFVDTEFVNILPSVNADQGWLYTNAKYWPSEKTAMYYMGLGGGSITGGRFLAPNAAENEGTYTNQLNYVNYDDVDAVFEALKTNGTISVSYNEDGEVNGVDVVSVPYFYTQAHDRKAYSVRLHLQATTHRKAEDNIIEDVVAYFAEGKPITTNTAYYTVSYDYVPTAIYTGQQGSFKVAKGTSYERTLRNDLGGAYGEIILVSQNRRGEYGIVGYAKANGKYTKVGTGSDLTYGQLEAKKEYVIVKGDGTHSVFSGSPFGVEHIVSMSIDGTHTYSGAHTGAFDKEYAYAVGGEENLSAIYFDDVTDSRLSASCDGISVVLTAKDVKKLDGSGKLVSVTQLKASEIGSYFYGDYKLTSGTNAWGLVTANYGYVTTDAYGNALQGYYLAENGSYFHLSNQVKGTNDKAYNKLSTNFQLRGADVATGITTGTDLSGALIAGDYNAITSLGVKGKAVVVDVTDVDGLQVDSTGKVTNWGYVDTNDDNVPDSIDGYPVRLATLSYEGAKCYENLKDAEFNFETLSFDYSDKRTAMTVTGTALSVAGLASKYALGDSTLTTPTTALFDASVNKHAAGIYYLETPKNDSDYYVLYCGPTSELDLEYSVNTRTETVTAVAADKKTELTAKAVKLDGIWYPAFETEEELIDFVVAIAGVKTLKGSSTEVTSEFYQWYKAAVADTKNPLKSSINSKGVDVVYGATMPTDAKSSSKAQACTYESTTDAVAVKVTADDSKVDTKVAGIYDITYTADVAEGAENATATVKVVVAPKYVRTWGANGKVATLTSFYVSNPEAKYAHYVYDWNAKKVTVTYYNVDGSVASTAVNSL